MNGTVVTAPGGIKGFDCNTHVSIEAGRALHKLGHRFAVRYVGREVERPNDLTSHEIADLFSAGLALMVVQHVESDQSWIPSDDKGRRYGEHAADVAKTLGVPSGVTVWLDLEGVSTLVADTTIIRYCNYWHDRVAAAGYQPGIYVGWHAGLTADQLYRRLKFARYWGAFNLNRDQEPAVRGICMKQREPTSTERTAVSFAIDGNTIKPDKKGDLPTLFAPDEWDGR